MNIIRSLTRRYRYPIILLRQMVITDFKLRYQGSALGYLWSLLRPLALFTILYLVFDKFLNVGKGTPFFPIYLLLGIVMWTFFTEVTNIGLVSIVDRGELLRKLNFPRYIVVLSAAVSGLINLTLNLIIVAIFMYFSHIDIRMVALYLPLLLIEMFVLSVAVAFFLSGLYVRFRDLSYIWELVIQAAFYATPILYPMTKIPHAYAKWLLLNPMAQIIQDTRYILVTNQAQTYGHSFGSEWLRAIPIGATIILAIGASLYFRRQSRYFAEDV